MPSSSDIQKSIDSLVSSRLAWNNELLDYNKRLSSASKGREKNALRKSIKNAEDQIKDLDRQVNKLQNDLKRATILESDKPTKLETIIGGVKDITGTLVDSGKLPTLGNLANKTKGTGYQEQFNDDANNQNKAPTLSIGPDLKNKLITYGIIGVVLLMLLMKKR